MRAPELSNSAVLIPRKIGLLRLQRKYVVNTLSRFFSRSSSSIPFVMPVFNNPTYAQQMLSQVRKAGIENVVIIDNGSRYFEMTQFLRNVEKEGVCVIRLGWNAGCHFLLQHDELRIALPDVFLYSDPDIRFNPQLPSDFVSSLVEVSRRFKIGKVGFALDISEPHNLKPQKFRMAGNREFTIVEWESQFWNEEITLDNGLIGYHAAIDTTFALYNKEFFDGLDFFQAIRLAGNFTAQHLPWYVNTLVPQKELDFYNQRSLQSHY